MERRAEINLSLLVCVSVCLHLLFIWAVLLPSMDGLKFRDPFVESGAGAGGGRDIVVNVNEDEKIVDATDTLLSEKSSSARGHLTEKRGDTFLNNSLDFRLPKQAVKGSSGTTGAANSSGKSSLPVMNNSLAQNSSAQDADSPEGITIIPLNKSLAGGGSEAQDSEWMKIPDKMGIDRNNALYLTNDGVFSYNTKKFADFKYFRDMKNKIASNWFPPSLANNYMLEGANKYGFYTPGYTRTHLIPSQEVRLYFRMNRNGDVIDIKIMNTSGSAVLIDSCFDAIKNSKTFGPVPDDMPGSYVTIPFIFAYVVWE
jgi:TonB family protein